MKLFDPLKTHIGVSYQEDLPSKIIDDFCSSIASTDIVLSRHIRERKVFANLGWALPTLIIVYLSKPYFEGFLQEAGKDHYNLLRDGILRLFKTLFGDQPKTSRTSYSKIFSIYIQTKDGTPIKFVFPEDISQEDYKLVVQEALDICANIYNDDVDKKELISKQQKTIYLKWSADKSEWQNLIEQEEITKIVKNQSGNNQPK